MIGKPEWFTYRISGWGIRPATKEGWIYSLIALVAILGSVRLPLPEETRFIVSILVIGIFVVDMVHISVSLGKVHDERENFHQMVIERNTAYTVIVLLGMTILAGSFYLSYLSFFEELPANPSDDPTMLVVTTIITFSAFLLLLMTVVKTISTLYYRRTK